MDTEYYKLIGKTGFLFKLGVGAKTDAELSGDTVYIAQGKSVKAFEVDDLREAAFVAGTDKYEIKKADLQGIGPLLSGLELKSRDDSYFYLEAKSFEQKDFIAFAKCFQAVFRRVKATFEEKIEAINKKCEEFLRRDQNLEKELTESMGEAYESVFQPYVLDKKDKNFNDIIKNPNVVFYHLNKHNNYYYYVRSNYRPDIPKQSMTIAQNLIDTVQKNMNIVNSRMQSYRGVQQKLQKMKNDHDQQMKLKKVAGKIGSLQERNMQQGNQTSDMGFDFGVLQQLDELTEKIHLVDNMEQSDILKEHLNLYETFMNDGNDVFLKDLNKKLS